MAIRMVSKRSIMRMQLDAASKQKLDNLCKRRGMTQIAVMTRMVNWFVTQDDMIQEIILGALTEESMASLARMMLNRLSADTTS